MLWVPLDSVSMRKASYDAARNLLVIRMRDGSTRKHAGVLPHMFENLTGSSDSDFYYRYYIEPSRVSEREGMRARLVRWLAFTAFAAAALLASAATGS